MTVEDDIGVTMRGQESKAARRGQGYVMAGLLVAIAVMSILMAAAMPSWRHMVQREREAELVFRGEQYARAVGLFQRKFAGAFPPSVDVLLQQKFLRKKYKDPMVPDGEFQVLYQTSAGQQPGQVGTPGLGGSSIGRPSPSPSPSSDDDDRPSPGQIGGRPSTAFGTAGPRGGVTGVVSKSTQRSIRLYKGRNRYNEWQFLYTEVSTRVVPESDPGGAAGGARRPGQGSRPGTTPGGMGRSPFGSPGRPTSPRPGGPGN
jgi:type II secretory pathway pseudopilin PulG